MDAAALVDAIGRLAGERPTGPWGVKDSYGRLDLTPIGFRRLFAATWCWRPSAPLAPVAAPPGVRWTAIRDAAAPSRWEHAWNGPAEDPLAPPPARIFQPSLLRDDRIAFLAVYRDEQLVAGAIMNEMAGTVGLSNLFMPSGEADGWWAGCLAAVADSYPGRPIVGYFFGDELAQAERQGFERSGPLQIWARPS